MADFELHLRNRFVRGPMRSIRVFQPTVHTLE